MNQLSDTLNTLSKEARKLVEVIMERSIDNFKTDGEVMPMVFFIDAMDNAQILALADFNDDTKPVIFDMIRKLRREFPVVVFITEVWMAGKECMENGQYVMMPRNSPKKTESIIIQLWDSSRRVTFKSEITRNPDQTGEWELLYDSQFPTKGGVLGLSGAMIDGEPCAQGEN